MKCYGFLLCFLFLLISCDYGLSSGNDLDGHWAAVLEPGKTVSYKLHKDGTGTVDYSAISLSPLVAEAKSTGITFWITQGTPYRKLHIDLNDDNFAQTYGKDNVYDYYFCLNKTRLFLRKRNTCCFIEYYKVGD